ncbi:hypothetical protein ACFOKF_02730 [Sphingobium rhizovicinum]|uniref:DUF3883 domain-containing protein n=1 Tax=Sphingobium rhizovicinum TaxID=432308 RepID=A0ABV7NCF3_9SPHN
MFPAESLVPLSLFDDVDRLAADHLNIASIKHRSALQRLSATPPVAFDGVGFVRTLFERVAGNWLGCIGALAKSPSRENWRWLEPKCDHAAHNSSPEVTLERAIVSAARSRGRSDWSNQVPIASGMIAGGGDRRRAIDLVHRRGPNAFEFVELKVGSDNPLYAAVEILKYGFVWLLSREHSARLGYGGKSLVEASDVRLSVLAPHPYYDGLNLGWLEAGLSRGVMALGAERQEVRLSFAFEAFPISFVWPDPDPMTALSALDQRTRV